MREKRILVIDDEESIRALLTDFLETEGFSVTAVATGEEGYQEAMRDDYRLIMCDLSLPGDDGITIIEHIKKNDPEVVVVIITGNSSMENLQSAIHVGAFDYISKPFDLDEVLFCVKRAVAARQLTLTNKRLLRDLSSQNDMLEQKVSERTKKLEQAYEHIEDVYFRVVSSLISTIEAKDPYTRHHSENVAKYSVLIAQKLGLAGDAVEHIRRAAFLHDIGKIGVKDSILHKNGPLSDEEYATIQRHPLTAKEILKPLLFMEDTIEIVLRHHERFDGTGYPDGLRGDQIIQGARVLAVADAYDAMMSNRPYRQRTFVHEKVLDEIHSHAGTQFDPAVVVAFLDVIKNHDYL